MDTGALICLISEALLYVVGGTANRKKLHVMIANGSCASVVGVVQMCVTLDQELGVTAHVMSELAHPFILGMEAVSIRDMVNCSQCLLVCG